MEKEPILVEATYDPEDDVLKLESSDHPLFCAFSISKTEVGPIIHFMGDEDIIFKVIINHFLDESDAWKCAFYQILPCLPEEFTAEIKKARTGFRYALTIMARRINVLENEINHY